MTMECNKDDAVKAREVAERKLKEGDPYGAQRFIEKSQRLFPGLEGLQQLTQVVQVHAAAHVKLNGETDWYAVLQVPALSSDDALIKKQYRKQALLLHPDKNRAVGADAAFKLINEAFTVLSDKAKKASHDYKRQVRSNLGQRQSQGHSAQHRPFGASATSAAGGRGTQANARSPFGSRQQQNHSYPRHSASASTPPPQPAPPGQFYTRCNKCGQLLLCKIEAKGQTVNCIVCKNPFAALDVDEGRPGTGAAEAAAATAHASAFWARSDHQRNGADAQARHAQGSGRNPENNQQVPDFNFRFHPGAAGAGAASAHASPATAARQAAAAAAAHAAAAAVAAAAAARGGGFRAQGFPGANAAQPGPQQYEWSSQRQQNQGFQFQRQFYTGAGAGQQQQFGTGAGMGEPDMRGPAADIAREAWRSVQMARESQNAQKQQEAAAARKKAREAEREERKKRKEKEREEKAKQRKAEKDKKRKGAKRRQPWDEDEEDEYVESGGEEEEEDLVDLDAANPDNNLGKVLAEDGEMRRRSRRQKRNVVYSAYEDDEEEATGQSPEPPRKRPHVDLNGDAGLENVGGIPDGVAAEGQGTGEEAEVVEVAGGNDGNDGNDANEEEEGEEQDIVEDSKMADFHDFDSGRGEESIKQGEVWALYDDEEGLPRYYAYIRSIRKVASGLRWTIHWLEAERGSVVPGRFCATGQLIKTAASVTKDDVSVFSHLVRSSHSKFPIRVWPRQGEVWACYDVIDDKAGEGDPAELGVKMDGKGNIAYLLVQVQEDYNDGMVACRFLRKTPGFNSVYEFHSLDTVTINIDRFSHLIPSAENKGSEHCIDRKKALPRPPRGSFDVDLAGMPKVVQDGPGGALINIE